MRWEKIKNKNSQSASSPNSVLERKNMFQKIKIIDDKFKFKVYVVTLIDDLAPTR